MTELKVSKLFHKLHPAMIVNEGYYRRQFLLTGIFTSEYAEEILEMNWKYVEMELLEQILPNGKLNLSTILSSHTH